jgi:hypothetical protein
MEAKGVESGFERGTGKTKKPRIAARLFMVGVARIELATPAMSTPSTDANLGFFVAPALSRAMIWIVCVVYNTCVGSSAPTVSCGSFRGGAEDPRSASIPSK